jgi:hypothetical protein
MQRQMRKIAADTGALRVDIMRRFHVMRVLVAEADMAVDEIDDRLDPRPSRRRCAEQGPGDIGELVGLAIAARHQIKQHVVGQLVDRQLLRGRHERIGQTGIAHQRLAAQGDAASGRDQAAAHIAKTVAVEADRHVGLGRDALGADDVGEARWVDREHGYHRRRLHGRIGDLEADPDLHGSDLFSPLYFVLRKHVGNPARKPPAVTINGLVIDGQGRHRQTIIDSGRSHLN